MVLPNPPTISNLYAYNHVPVAPGTDFNDTLNRFKDKLSKSIEESLGVQIKPNRTTYHKPYALNFDFMKAPDGWRVPKIQW